MNTTALLSAALSGDPASTSALERWPIDAVKDAARRHGVLPLLADRVGGSSARLREALGADAAGEVAADLFREAELRRVLDGFAAAGVAALVIKGAALAYTHYERPDLRARDDSDLLIQPDGQPAAHGVLGALGYRRGQHVAGELVSAQAAYTKRLDGATVHTIDLHWRIANPHVFTHVLTFEELRRDAVPVAGLGASAFAPSAPYALFLACVHRVAHHRDADLLIWVYDIHLLASRLTPAEWRTFLALAIERDMATICRQGLTRAAAAFNTIIPDAVSGALQLRPGRREASAAFLTPERAQFATLLSDLRTLRSWRERRRLVREHLLPSSSYMRETYAPSSRAPLAVLYFWRALRGAWRWLARA